MKRSLFVLLLIAASCSEQPADTGKVLAPFVPVESENWVTYEGRILSDDGVEVYIELSLLENAVGLDSKYTLVEMFTIEDIASMEGLSMGTYSVVYGLPGQETGIEINDKNSLRTTGILHNPKRTPEDVEQLRNRAKTKLFFRTRGPEQLVLTDDDFDPIGNEQYVVYRRSKLFTVEGYVTVEEKRTEFFEGNTREDWHVAKLGAYDSVKIKYYDIAKEKFEGVYLKALAYSVADTTTKTQEALVIKRILEMRRGKKVE